MNNMRGDEPNWRIGWAWDLRRVIELASKATADDKNPYPQNSSLHEAWTAIRWAIEILGEVPEKIIPGRRFTWEIITPTRTITVKVANEKVMREIDYSPPPTDT